MRPTPAQLRKLATHPASYVRFVSTGRLPDVERAPSSPLTLLMESLAPRELAALRGVEIGPGLGYSGRRVFATGSQALAWLRPVHAGAHHPAESWRDKRFSKTLTRDELFARCASHRRPSAPPDAPQTQPRDASKPPAP